MNIPNVRRKERKMSNRADIMGQRYNELMGQGVSYKEAAEHVNEEFGEKLNEATIRNYGHKYKKKVESG